MRIRTAVLIYATVLVGRGIAQDADTVTSNATKALQQEWRELEPYPSVDFTSHTISQQSGVLHCLHALEIYARVGLSAAERDQALTELTLGSPNSATTFSQAQELEILPRILATAAKENVGKDDKVGVDAVFRRADTAITNAYKSNKDALDRAVNQEYLNNPARALYGLLKITAGDFQKDVDTATGSENSVAKQAASTKVKNAVGLIELYRVCYGLDHNRLFALVNKHFK
jgi:hypothetical protein